MSKVVDDEIAKTAQDTNMKFVRDRGAQKVAAGATTAEEVLRATGA